MAQLEGKQCLASQTASRRHCKGQKMVLQTFLQYFPEEKGRGQTVRNGTVSWWCDGCVWYSAYRPPPPTT